MYLTTYLLDYALPVAGLLVWLIWDCVVWYLYQDVPWNGPGDWPTLTGVMRKVSHRFPAVPFLIGFILGGLCVHLWFDG